VRPAAKGKAGPVHCRVGSYPPWQSPYSERRPGITTAQQSNTYIVAAIKTSAICYTVWELGVGTSYTLEYPAPGVIYINNSIDAKMLAVMAKSNEACPHLSPLPLQNPAARAQLEFRGGRPLVSVTDDCWRSPKLPRYPSAERSGRELRTMEWRCWNTCAVGGMCWKIYGVGDVFWLASLIV